MLKKYLKAFIYTFGIILISMIVITLFSYFNILNVKLINVLKLIVIISSIFIGAFIIGKNSLKKGYLEGIKYGLMFIGIIFIINIIFIKELQLSLIIYYLIILVSSILGSMFGINFKKNDD